MTAPRWDHHLLPGERLLWQGRPQRFAQGPVWRVILTLAGLVLLAFSGFVGWLTSVLSSDSGIAALAGTAAGGAMTLSAAGLGLWLIAAQWVTRLDRSSWTAYALSTRAAYIRYSNLSPKLEIYEIRPDTAIEHREGARGGTIDFHSHREDNSDGPVTLRAGFRNISDAPAVLAMIRDIQARRA